MTKHFAPGKTDHLINLASNSIREVNTVPIEVNTVPIKLRIVIIVSYPDDGSTFNIKTK